MPFRKDIWAVRGPGGTTCDDVGGPNTTLGVYGRDFLVYGTDRDPP